MNGNEKRVWRKKEKYQSKSKLNILGDLNGWIGGGTRTGITVAFGARGESDNSRRVVEYCAE